MNIMVPRTLGFTSPLYAMCLGLRLIKYQDHILQRNYFIIICTVLWWFIELSSKIFLCIMLIWDYTLMYFVTNFSHVFHMLISFVYSWLESIFSSVTIGPNQNKKNFSMNRIRFGIWSVVLSFAFTNIFLE